MAFLSTRTGGFLCFGVSCWVEDLLLSSIISPTHSTSLVSHVPEDPEPSLPAPVGAHAPLTFVKKPESDKRPEQSHALDLLYLSQVPSHIGTLEKCVESAIDMIPSSPGSLIKRSS